MNIVQEFKEIFVAVISEQDGIVVNLPISAEVDGVMQETGHLLLSYLDQQVMVTTAAIPMTVDAFRVSLYMTLDKPSDA